MQTDRWPLALHLLPLPLCLQPDLGLHLSMLSLPAVHPGMLPVHQVHRRSHRRAATSQSVGQQGELHAIAAEVAIAWNAGLYATWLRGSAVTHKWPLA